MASMAAAEREYPTDYPASLDATIRIVHGVEVIADNGESNEEMCRRFEEGVGSEA
jgi:hypothetical protein